MDAPDLRIFESVARNGSMNRAAAELHTVQSNVNARIRLLGEDLGTPLSRSRSVRGSCPCAARVRPADARAQTTPREYVGDRGRIVGCFDRRPVADARREDDRLSPRLLVSRTARH